MSQSRVFALHAITNLSRVTTRFWKRVLVATVSLVAAVSLAVVWVVYRAHGIVKSTFANSEHTELHTSLSMLDGRLHVGLYRQQMWDAVLWTVMASPDSLPLSLDAPSGVITRPLSLLFTDTQLGFREPPLQLRAVSATDAELCGKMICRTIRCIAPHQRCELVSQQ